MPDPSPVASPESSPRAHRVPGASVGAGKLLSISLEVWLKNFLPFTLIQLAASVPYFLWIVGVDQARANPVASILFAVIGSTLALLTNALASGTITFGVFTHLRGDRAPLGECFRQGKRRFGKVIGTSLLASFAIAIGLVALVVPGLILTTMLVAAVPVAVVEGIGGVPALKRSAELSRDNRGQIFVAVLVIGILALAVNYVVGKLSGGTDAGLGGQFVQTLASVVVGGLSATAAPVIYHELRRVKEGAVLDDLIKVFA